MSHYLYDEIFGESPQTLEQREQAQTRLRKLNYELDNFFERSELAADLGRPDLAQPIDVRELQRAIGIETDEQPVSGTFSKNLERPLLIDDRLGRAARKLIAKEVGKLRRSNSGEILSMEAGLRSAWNEFSEYANNEQKSIAESAIKQCDSAVVQALLREAMHASEVSL